MTKKNSLHVDGNEISLKNEVSIESGVGPLLRAARMRVGSDIAEIALALRIRRPYLEAIEENRYESLPGTTYTVGFIRSYAEHLGLDADEVVRRFKNEYSQLRKKQKLIFPAPIAENRIPGITTILLGVVLVFFTYSAWQVSIDGDIFPEAVISIPEHFSSILSGSNDNSGSGSESGGTKPLSLTGSQTSSIKTGIELDNESKNLIFERVPSAEVEKESKNEEQVASDLNNKNMKEPLTQEGNSSEQTVEAVFEESVVQESVVLSTNDNVSVVSPKSLEEKVPVLGEGSAEELSTIADERPSAVDEEGATSDMISESQTNAYNAVSNNNSNINALVEDKNRKRGFNEAVSPEKLDVLSGAEEPLKRLNENEKVFADNMIETTDSSIVSASNVLKNVALQSNNSSTSSRIPSVSADTGITVGEPQNTVIEEEKTSTVLEPDTNIELEASKPKSNLELEVSNLNTEEVKTNNQSPDDKEIFESKKVEIVATGNSWIQIRDDINNKMLMTRLMQTGDRYQVPDQEGLHLLTGNAGAIEIFVDGIKAPSIGGAGVVRRKVILDGDKLINGIAVDR